MVATQVGVDFGVYSVQLRYFGCFLRQPAIFPSHHYDTFFQGDYNVCRVLSAPRFPLDGREQLTYLGR